jgi:HEPN domain-containing protein
MKKNNKKIVQKVLKWIEYADEDLKAAEITSSISSNIPFRIIAFHSQQCAEKYLKAFLVFHSIDFPYTHNISTLIELCMPIIDLNKKLNSAKELSKYAVAVRYPTEYLKISNNEALRTIKIATKVKNVITDLLIKEGLNLKEK